VIPRLAWILQDVSVRLALPAALSQWTDPTFKPENTKWAYIPGVKMHLGSPPTMRGRAILDPGSPPTMRSDTNSWIFHFHPPGPTNLADEPGAEPEYVRQVPWPSPPTSIPPAAVDAWTIHNLDELPPSLDKRPATAEEFIFFILHEGQITPESGLWAYVKLGNGFDYQSLLSAVESCGLNAKYKKQLRDWVVAQAKDNGDTV